MTRRTATPGGSAHMIDAWTTLAREGVTVHAEPGSPAEDALRDELEAALRIREELGELLDPPRGRRFEPIDVFVVVMPESPDDVPEVPAGSVVRFIHPEAPCEPLAWPLTRELVARWFGEHVAGSGAIVDGVAGVVADRVGSGPSLAEADGVALDFLSKGPMPSLLGPEEQGPPILTERHLLATSFVAYLLATHGRDALRVFLSHWDDERHDEAALAAYNEPLAALEESWHASVGPDISVHASLRRLGRQLLPLLRANWLRELEVTGYTLLDSGFSIGIPLLTALFVNELTAGNEDAIVPYILLLTGFFLLLTPISLRREYAGTVLSQEMLFQLQHDVFRRLLYLPHSYHARQNLGDLMVRLTSDVDRVREATEAVLRQAVYVVIKALAAAAVLFYIDPLLALCSIATVPLFWIGHLLFNKRLEEASDQTQAAYGELGTATQESLSAHSPIKAFGLEERTLAEYRARTRRFFGSVRRLVVLGSTLDASSSMAVTAGQVVVLGVGGYMVANDRLEIGFLLMFLQVLPMFFEAIGTLTGVRRTVTQASGAMDRVLEVLDEPLVIEDKPGAAPLAPLSDEIRFEDVTFGYSPEQPVLQGVSLTIPSGANIAIVGRSGCGKTTIINLLLRFWDPDSGRVLIDGQDLRDVTLASLRGQIGLVFQETFVFDTTLRENIAIAREDATDEEIAEALRAARLDDYVRGLPAGYDTVLGERGVRMSGGQRQRLAIARALVRDPRILVLDEATSALDPETEAEVQETLSELSRGRTTISITHRLASVTESDRIFVLDRGRLVEEGKHDELMALGGLYRGQYEEQLGNGEPE